MWAEHGVGHAIIAGDALATLAFQILLEDPTPERVRAAGRLAEATQDMISGQAEDMASELRASLSVEECLHMEAGKTGALLSCAASMGAILGGCPGARRRGVGGLRPPPRDRLPGHRRRARDLGRAERHRQAGRQRPAPAQEVAARRHRARPWRGPARRARVTAGTRAHRSRGLRGRRFSSSSAARARRRSPSGSCSFVPPSCRSERVPLEPGPRSELAAIARYVTERDR